VPGLVVVEKENDRLIISWPWYDSIFNKVMVAGLIFVLISMAAWFLLPRLVINSNDIAGCPLIFFVPGVVFLIASLDKNKVVIEGKNVEACKIFLGFRPLEK